MHRGDGRAIGILGVLLLLAVPLGAQDHPAVERGFAADKLYQLADLDSVNLMNGAVAVRIPIGGTSGGRGAQLPASATTLPWPTRTQAPGS